MTHNEIIPTIDDGWRDALLLSLFPRTHESDECHREWSLSPTLALISPITKKYSRGMRTGGSARRVLVKPKR